MLASKITSTTKLKIGFTYLDIWFLMQDTPFLTESVEGKLRSPFFIKLTK
ncbi:hypothetical protein ACE1B6_07705 [Aerosakkonemataceae cyanobacterium BLCC-F154]|uniref:Uncharacterized protein n=1 Tax=Floridaenema fluviatile BLCC-F154 TaxID=3153640 RepID=A0ABV4Y8K4_9CYAN